MTGTNGAAPSRQGGPALDGINGQGQGEAEAGRSARARVTADLVSGHRRGTTPGSLGRRRSRPRAPWPMPGGTSAAVTVTSVPSPAAMRCQVIVMVPRTTGRRLRTPSAVLLASVASGRCGKSCCATTFRHCSDRPSAEPGSGGDRREGEMVGENEASTGACSLVPRWRSVSVAPLADMHRTLCRSLIDSHSRLVCAVMDTSEKAARASAAVTAEGKRSWQ